MTEYINAENLQKQIYTATLDQMLVHSEYFVVANLCLDTPEEQVFIAQFTPHILSESRSTHWMYNQGPSPVRILKIKTCTQSIALLKSYGVFFAALQGGGYGSFGFSAGQYDISFYAPGGECLLYTVTHEGMLMLDKKIFSAAAYPGYVEIGDSQHRLYEQILDYLLQNSSYFTLQDGFYQGQENSIIALLKQDITATHTEEPPGGTGAVCRSITVKTSQSSIDVLRRYTGFFYFNKNLKQYLPYVSKGSLYPENLDTSFFTADGKAILFTVISGGLVYVSRAAYAGINPPL